MRKLLTYIAASLTALFICIGSVNAADKTAKVERVKFTGFEHGMGIGGWLTNYKRFNVLPEKWKRGITIGDMEHFQSYITEADVKNIADLGCDHIRLGFDQIVLEESPYVYREEIFKLIDNFIGWCKKYNINVVLNMHKAVGNYCDMKEKVGLLDSPELQNRFIAMWNAFEKRYHNDNSVVFELLNEVLDVNPKLWNDLAEKSVAEIRKVNPTRKIIIGSTCWNGPHTLKNLKIYDDPNIIYTFHFYGPFEFTHQRGVLQSGPLYYNRVMRYPADIAAYNEYRKCVGEGDYGKTKRMDINTLRSMMYGAIEFAQKHPDKHLWCGEFGTIRHAPLNSRENWMNDVIKILKENQIPYCVWNYLSTPNDGNRFSLVDDETRKILSPRLHKIILGEVE